MGNRGSARAIDTVVGVNGQEYVVAAGCDRHVRIFDPNCELQKNSEIAHAYVKQKVNSVLISPL